MPSARSAEGGATATPARYAWIVTALVIIGLSYNGILSAINANVMALNVAHVVLAEFVVLSVALIVVVSRGFFAEDLPAIGLGAVFVLGSLILSFINQAIVIEALRNVAIIVLFTMLGIRSDGRTIRTTLIWIVAIVFAIMILELAALQTYVDIFNPWRYYFNTRGLDDPEFSETGLFRNALGFEGRFSFGFFDAPRTSSIFMEQTSLANFASVIVIYLLTLWRSLSKAQKWLCCIFVVTALVSNSTRMSSIFALLGVIGYFVYPLIPRFVMLLQPLLMLGLAAVAVIILGPSVEDDFAGRLGLTLELLRQTDLNALLGLRALQATGFPDSGYPYIIYTSSIFGALILWFYIALIVPPWTEAQRRCAFGAGIFLFLNLLVAGNAIFTMKVACPLWLLVGFMRSPAYAAMASVPGGRKRAAQTDETAQ